MIRRVLLILGFVCAALPLGRSAPAYQCLQEDARSRLARSDGAFIGRLSSREVDAFTASREVDSRFRVEEPVKGQLGREVVVRNQGLAVRTGQLVGLLLERRDEVWTAGVCSNLDPDLLRRAAKPLPAPDSYGPVSFLMGGRFGDVRTIALDRRARTVAYGKGRGAALLLDVCEGSGRMVEVVHGDFERGGLLLGVAIRDVATLQLHREMSVEMLAGPLSIEAISCRDSSASEVFLVGRTSSDDRRVVRVRNDASAVVFEGRGRIALFASERDVAFLTSGKSILEIDMRSGRSEVVAELPLTPGSLALSPDEETLAGTNGAHAPDGRVFKLDLRSGDLLTVPGLSGNAVWIDDSRFAVLPGEGAIRVYGDELDVVSSWSGLPTDQAVAVAQRLYSAGRDGRFVVASGLRGDVRLMREFDFHEVYALTHVMGGPSRPVSGLQLRQLAVVLDALALMVAFGLWRAALSRKTGMMQM